MKKEKEGLFIVIDGLDGIGKGVCLDVLKEEAEKSKFKVFDLNEYWKDNNNIPTLEEIREVDVIVSSEPTYQGIGKYIRDTLVSKNNKNPFSTSIIAQAYSLDREILYERLIIPARKKGITIFQSRSVSTSIAYQKLSGEKDGVDLKFILNLSGNKLALANPPNYLIIPTIMNVEEIMNRLECREKKDDCVFENLDFQLEVKKEYESQSFKKIFEKRGTRILYVDVGKTLEHSKNETRKLFEDVFVEEMKEK